IVLAGALVWEAAKPGDEPGDSGERAAGSGPGQRQSGPVEPRPGPGSDGAGELRTGSADANPGLEASSCPAGLSNCVVARGRVIYVEAVDPDGDGDAHFVTSSRQSVTLPGITVFDVKADLRPDPLPSVGDLVGGAGPVFPGSRGQKQIEVIEFHVAG
ncbi:MAG: hypothetical protein ACERKT_09710, partial [Acidobacteriota bacterium]